MYWSMDLCFYDSLVGAIEVSLLGLLCDPTISLIEVHKLTFSDLNYGMLLVS